MYEKKSSQSKAQPKVQSLDNQYIRQETLKSIEARRKRYIKTVHRRRLFTMLSLIGAVILFLGFQIVQADQNNAQLQSQVVSTKHQLQAEKTKNNGLKLQVKQMENPTYLEKIIRSKYYYSKPGEIIFSLPSDKPIH